MLAEKPLSSFLAAFIIGALLTTCSSEFEKSVIFNFGMIDVAVGIVV